MHIGEETGRRSLWCRPDSTVKCASTQNLDGSGLRVGFVVNLDQLFHRDVSINLRRRETRVAEQFLDVAQVGATVQKMRRKRMTQGVRADVVNAGAESNIF